jgi:hypothetical protein
MCIRRTFIAGNNFFGERFLYQHSFDRPICLFPLHLSEFLLMADEREGPILYRPSVTRVTAVASCIVGMDAWAYGVPFWPQTIFRWLD